ncbi:MAG: sulfatase [Actinomycetota bacterium]
MGRRFPALALSLLLAAGAASACSPTSDPRPPAAADPTVSDPAAPSDPPPRTPTRPGHPRAVADPAASGEPAKNIILILTDDQRWDSLWAMAAVQQRLGAPGVTFSNAYVVNPLCCPSRASILTGLYSHHTNVWRNTPPHGGYPSFDPRSTVATWLQDAGYRTALVGKYLNGYEDPSVVPPGWDEWFAFLTGSSEGFGGSYRGFDVSNNGHEQRFGGDEPSYSLDVLERRSLELIRTTRERPLFLYLAVPTPHSPTIPAPEHAKDFLSGLQPHRPPNFNEEDVSDKPRWVQRQRPLNEQGIAEHVDGRQRKNMQTLLSVDEMVGRIVAAIDRQGELEESLIVFASDNGLFWGEHRLRTKLAPYEEAIRIPLVVRYDAAVADPASREDRLALNIDFAATFAEAAGLRLEGDDGASLLPLLRGEAPAWRERFVVEHLGPEIGLRPRVPTYCGVHGERWVYVRYVTGEEELYDLQLDPFQLENLADDPAYVEQLRTERAAMVRGCRPPPPGMRIGR